MKGDDIMKWFYYGVRWRCYYSINLNEGNILKEFFIGHTWMCYLRVTFLMALRNEYFTN
jgi:hypothetical protein